MAIRASTQYQPSPPVSPAVKDERLRDERNRFLAFAFAAADLLIEVDVDLRIGFAIGAAEGLAGRGIAALLSSDFLGLFSASDRAVIRAAVKRMQGKNRMESITLRMVKPDRQEIGVALSGCRLPFLHGAIQFAISAVRSGMPGIDAGSNLLDKTAFEATALGCIGQRETLDRDASLNLLQLDGVEDFRSAAGEGAIDNLFNEIGGILRAYAVAGVAGRVGPDRLAAITDGNTHVDFANEIAEILRIHDPEGSRLQVKSLTVALDVTDLTPVDAAKALSYTLQEFANGDITKLPFRSLVDGFREMMAKTAQRMVAFRQSLTDHGMKLVFQPVVELGVRQIHHYEALTRFADNKSPFEAIEFAERIGLIEELDLTVAERALKYLDNAGPGCTASLAVNISGRSIQNDGFSAALEKLLRRYPVVRPRIMFEITESNSITNLAQAEQIIQSFRRAGNQVCLDDFGAGAASLPYLRAFHVDYIKIDGAYVRRMQDSDRDRQILHAMVSMCQQVKTSIVAEMIETQQQAQALMALGVEFGQGYYFGKPADTLASLPPLRGRARL
jgi:EAL domain-containing protein (putative c-di-GMP-specific phosphodiesterase class I)/GGDEF domain-containing protein